MRLDNWQKEVLKTKGNVALCSGRQVGKSTIVSIKAGEYAMKNKDKTILIIAKAERQNVGVYLQGVALEHHFRY